MLADARRILRDWLLGATLPAPATDAEAQPLVAEAESQGLVGQLAASARAAGGWPAETLVLLREKEHALLVRGVALLDLTSRAQELLARRALRSLPLKGAAVAEGLYDSPAHRPMSDVDLLALDEPSAALATLEREGFRRFAHGDHAWVLRDPATGGTLELHAGLTSCPGLHPIDTQAIWDRRRAGDGQVRTLPGNEDLLVHLALHAAFQHALVLSLGQYLDFRRLLERLPLDLDRLMAAASAARAGPALAAALIAAEAAVGARCPLDLESRLEALLPSRLRSWLAGRCAQPLTLLVPSRPALAAVRWMLTPNRRLELLRRTLLAGPPGERLGPSAALARAVSRALRLARPRF